MQVKFAPAAIALVGVVFAGCGQSVTVKSPLAIRSNDALGSVDERSFAGGSGWGLNCGVNSFSLWHTKHAHAKWTNVTPAQVRDKAQGEPCPPVQFLSGKVAILAAAVVITNGATVASEFLKPYVFITFDGGSRWNTITPHGLGNAPIGLMFQQLPGRDTIWLFTETQYLQIIPPGPEQLYSSNDFGQHWRLRATVPERIYYGGVPPLP